MFLSSIFERKKDILFKISIQRDSLWQSMYVCMYVLYSELVIVFFLIDAEWSLTSSKFEQKYFIPKDYFSYPLS
jgi:hypothetical protein